MAEKKKAYGRFQELARQATAASMPAEADTIGEGSPAGEAIRIRLGPEVRRALEQQAAAERTTPTAIIEEALRRYLETPR
jgi:hypothetical protein